MSEKLNLEMLGKRVQQARLRKGLTQFALAEDVGVSQNFLGDVERGLKVPGISTCIKLANVLGLSLDELFNESLEVKENIDDIYLTEKQIVILKKLVKDIKCNFFD